VHPFEVAEPDGDRGRRPRERLAQRIRERQKRAAQSRRRVVCGAQKQTPKADSSHATQQLVGHVGSVGDRHAVGFCVAGEHRGPEVLASTPKRLELLLGPLEEYFPVIVDNHDIFGLRDVTRPRAPPLHHDERDIAHVDLPRRGRLHLFRVLGRISAA
jgi:dienelactone hydrolase